MQQSHMPVVQTLKHDHIMQLNAIQQLLRRIALKAKGDTIIMPVCITTNWWPPLSCGKP